jgi:alpha-glucosidase
MRFLALVVAPVGFLLAVTLLSGREPEGRPAAERMVISPPPEALKLDAFYAKYVDAGGIPIISSAKVPDEALFMAADLVLRMLDRRPDVLKALAENKVRVAVMAKTELTTDIPEHSRLRPKEYWDKRARGLGGTPHIPTTSCGEENLLGYEDDRYCGESILVHEFAHTIHDVGLAALDRQFDARLKRIYDQAMSRGLWKQTYAATNHKEYWAEGVQSYFDCNLHADPPNGNHNHVRTREQLREYDPDLFDLIDEVFVRNPWRWTPNGAHARKWPKKEPDK